MFVHKILRGDGAEKYLPFALSRLRALERAYGSNSFYQQKYEVDDAKIEVSQEPPYQYVRITAGGPFFEFFTSGKPARTTVVTQGGFSFLGYEYAAIITRPRLVPDEDGVKHLVTKSSTPGRKTPDIKAPSGRLPQIQLADEPVAYTGDGSLVYKCYAPATPFSAGVLNDTFAPGNGLYGYITPVVQRFNVGTIDVAHSRDVGVDVPFEYARSRYAKDAYITTNADWPRANGIQKVVDPLFGTRRFGIMNDAFNQFHVFPLSEITPNDVPYSQNVPVGSVKMVKPVLPDWVYTNPVKVKDAVTADFENSFRTTPEYDWQFSHDGKKACAVVIRRQQVFYDAAYFAADQGLEPHDAEGFPLYQHFDAGMVNRFYAQDTTWEAYPNSYHHAPGLLLITITITLTGSLIDAFNVAIDLIEVRDPISTPYCTLLAGFAWQDIESEDSILDERKYDARAGDLLVLDVERWYNATSVQVKTFLSLKNLAKEAGHDEIRAFNGDNVFDYDFPTVSFAIREVYDTTETVSYPHAQGGPAVDTPTMTRHFGIGIWTQNKFRELLFPDSMTEPIRLELLSAITINPRDYLTPPEEWFLMPLNDLRDWGDTGLAELRFKWASNDEISDPQYEGFRTHQHKDPDMSPGEPSTYDLDWLSVAMKPGPYYDARYLIFAANPCFGWFIYTNEIIERSCISNWSTFFVHPNGTWAFFHNQLFYSKNRMKYNFAAVNNLDEFDITKMENCVFDRVHFEMKDAQDNTYTKDTTFFALYAEAISDDPDKQETLQMHPITRADVSVTMSPHAVRYHPAVSIYILEISMTRAPTTLYLPAPEYEEHRSPHTVPPGSVIFGGGATLDLNLGHSIPNKSKPDWGGPDSFAYIMNPGTVPLTHFSSCVLIT